MFSIDFSSCFDEIVQSVSRHCSCANAFEAHLIDCGDADGDGEGDGADEGGEEGDGKDKGDDADVGDDDVHIDSPLFLSEFILWMRAPR